MNIEILKQPKGWTRESFQSAWESLGGDFESVADAVRDHFDNPEGFAAWLHYQALGKWPREKEDDEIEVYDDDEMLEVLRNVLREKNISLPHPATFQEKKEKTKNFFVNDNMIILGKSFYIKNAEIPFECYCDILKVEEKEGKYYLVGIASDTRIDKDNEIISENALKEMVEEIKKGNVVLLPSHKSDWDEEMGRVVDAEITPNNELKIVAELDMENDLCKKLVKAIQKGKQLGLSIGGAVKKVFQKFVPAINKVVRVIDSLVLKHIAITSRPANPRTWLTVISKSIDKEVSKYMTIEKQEEKTIEQQIAELEEQLKKATEEGNEQLVEEIKNKIAELKSKLENNGNEEKECKGGINKMETITLKLTKEEYEKIKNLIEKEKLESNPIYKSLKSEVEVLKQTIEELRKSLSERKSEFVSKEVQNNDVILKEFKESLSNVKTEGKSPTLIRKELKQKLDEILRKINQ